MTNTSYRIIPGLTDTHNHGTYGYNLMGEGTLEEQKKQVRGYLKGCAAQGLTSVFPTPSLEMIKAVSEVAKEDTQGAEIVGIHSEGPWLNRTGEKGIWQPWPEVSLKTAEKMVQDGDGLLKLVSVAPEIEGIESLTSYFKNQGIVLGFAHSDLHYSGAKEAFEKKGFSISTHTGNVMTGMHHRDVGGLGAALLEEDVHCEIICDGMHICFEMLEIYFKMKPYSKFIMISDCTPFSGAPKGSYSNIFPDTPVNVTEEGFVLSETGRLMGSSQPILFGVKNLVEKLSIPMEIVLEMASLNACRKYGLKDKGSISNEKDADFVILDDDYKTVRTFVRGKEMFNRDIDQNLFNPEFVD